MASNPYYNKVVNAETGTTLVDLTADTVDAAHLAEGYTAHDASGAPITGTMGSPQRVLSGSSAPTSSQGSDGDLYLVLSGSGSVEAYPADYTTSQMSSTSNASACIDKSADDGSSTANMYSSGNNTTGVVEYSFDLSSVPAGVTISSVSCRVMAHEENASRSSFTLQLYSGDTPKGSETTVSGTSNTIYTLSTGSWTRAEIDSLVLHTEYGYYGGLVAGATLVVEYESDPQASCTLTVKEDGWSLAGDMYMKSGGSWSKVATAALEDTVGR